MMLKPVLVTPPAADKPLVSLADAKKHLRVDHVDDDGYIEGVIAAATAWLDGYSGVLGRALIDQTWRLNMDCWPACRIRLPLAPVSAITSIKYYDGADAQQTLSATNYSLVEDALSPAAQWAFNASLPALHERPDAIEVLFVAGYGATASDVPRAIRHAALMLIAHLYENRETVLVGTNAQTLPFAVDALIAPFRRVGL
ncbi:head-tail connector protein [Taklimakanibacter deserti]|uniref:head-tail connector protein n=1 Tax=Taklimakanibacter deserti TaxID=2267839 RepID=UPI0034D6582F